MESGWEGKHGLLTRNFSASGFTSQFVGTYHKAHETLSTLNEVILIPIRGCLSIGATYSQALITVTDSQKHVFICADVLVSKC